MKPTAKLLLMISIAATLTLAQNPAIQHIIVVVQENRTPDVLFQDPNLINAGADITISSQIGVEPSTPSPHFLIDCHSKTG